MMQCVWKGTGWTPLRKTAIVLAEWDIQHMFNPRTGDCSVVICFAQGHSSNLSLKAECAGLIQE